MSERERGYTDFRHNEVKKEIEEQLKLSVIKKSRNLER